MPKYTVLMCCNRDDAFLMPAIDSVLGQTFSDFEFIIVLNACEDALYDKVVECSGRDRRVKVFRTRIAQLCFNLNYGLDKASGEYIIRFDADDICDKARIAVTDEIIAGNPAVDVLAGSCNVIDVNSNITGYIDISRNANWRKRLLVKNPFVHPAMAIRTSLLLEVGGYIGGTRTEDYDLWLRLARRPFLNVELSSYPMISYRIGANQSRGKRIGYAESASHLLREFLLRPSIGLAFGAAVGIGKVFAGGKGRIKPVVTPEI